MSKQLTMHQLTSTNPTTYTNLYPVTPSSNVDTSALSIGTSTNLNDSLMTIYNKITVTSNTTPSGGSNGDIWISSAPVTSPPQ